ncbi:MAG: ABC transporter permease subunit [Rhodobacterales bacterium]|nr:ABC transporter permease subunit [Rhodobacterales bacterium]
MAGPILTAPPGAPRLADWPGLVPSVWLSVRTGVVAGLVSLGLTVLLLAALATGRGLGWLRRMLSPLLALPHAAAALGLAFLIAPSGWVARMLSPWATGWTAPPDALILNDPGGWSLIAGLVAKEVPFLLLMGLAALPQTRAAQAGLLAAALGYGRIWGFLLTVWPAVWPQLRLPMAAVLAYGMTTVDMGRILGPGLPPPLGVQVVVWAMQPDPVWHVPAAEGAALLMALVALVLGVLRLAEALPARAGRALARAGWRGAGAEGALRGLAVAAGGTLGVTMAAAMAGLAVWSVAGPWRFPQAWPQALSLAHWARALPELAEATRATVAIAVLSTAAALALALGWLAAGGGRQGRAMAALVYLPLILPQPVFLPGLQVLALRAGLDGSLLAVAAVHLVFVLPYVILSLAGPWAAWDDRLAMAAAGLGAGPARVFWRLRLPMLLAPLATAAAVGVAVSVAQYLPTLLIGAGRIATLTTEAVALSSGQNRRLIGIWAGVQAVLPAATFALAMALPAAVWRNRRGMRP